MANLDNMNDDEFKEFIEEVEGSFNQISTVVTLNYSRIRAMSKYLSELDERIKKLEVK